MKSPFSRMFAAALSFRSYRSLMERTWRQSAQMRGCFAGEMGGGVLPSTLTRNRLCRRKKSSGMRRGEEHFGQRRVERGACFMAATGLKVKGRAWSRAGTSGGSGNPEGFRFGTVRGPWGGSRFWAARGRAGRRTVRRRRMAAEMRRFCASGPRGGHAKARASGLRGARGPWGAVSRFGALLFCAAAFAFAVTTDGEAGRSFSAGLLSRRHGKERIKSSVDSSVSFLCRGGDS